MKLKLIALAASLLAGCADEQTSSVPAVHKGESRAAVEARMGKPDSVMYNGDGQLVCLYSPGEARLLIPIFGELSNQQQYTVRYSHGVVVAWGQERLSAL